MTAVLERNEAAWRADCERVFALHRQGQLAEAADGCRVLLAERKAPAILHLLGIITAQLGHLDAAIELLAEASSAGPGDPLIEFNLGRMLWQRGRFAEALERFTAAVRSDPADVTALFWQGNALRMLQRPAEALLAYDQLLRRQVLHPEALCARAGALQDLGRTEEALRAYEALTARFPDYPQANYQLGLCRLQLGIWDGAWAPTEWRRRLHTLSIAARAFPYPQWDGLQSLEGRTLVLHHEQGFGDTVQMCRFARVLERRGAHVALLVPAPLRALLETLSPTVDVLPEEFTPERADFHCPMMSLPAALGLLPSALPGEIPYLAADPARARRWHERLGNEQALRVGLAWAGGFRADQPETWPMNERRNVRLADLAPLRRPGVRLFSLQKGAAAEAELATLREGAGWRIEDLSAELGDFADTAAVIANLDLVVTVDTAVAHVAGALGKPVWILNRFDSCWRWMNGRADSPWYPTARLYRQARMGEWGEVIARVGDDLDALARARAS